MWQIIKHAGLRVIAAAAISLAGVAVIAAPAVAHIQVTGHKAFYFSGTTYHVSATGTATIEDPVNLMVFEDSQSGQLATDANVVAALKSHWAGPRSLTSDDDPGQNCVHNASGAGPSQAWLKEVSYAGANGVAQSQYLTHDDEVLNGTLGSFPFNPPPFNSCVKEYHFRWWDDLTHAVMTNGSASADRHGQTGQFVIGGVHYENRPSFGAHYIDRDWYLVRNQFIHDEPGLCSMKRFLYNPAADSATGHNFQGFTSDGWIGYLSLHATPNCP